MAGITYYTYNRDSTKDIIEDTTKHISQLSDGTNTYAIKDAEARSELSNKQDTLVSGTNIKTINGNSLLGNGNLNIGGSVDIDEETITKNTNNELQAVAIVNPNINNGAISPLKIWNGTEYQWSHYQSGTWYCWKTATPSWHTSELPSSRNWYVLGYGNNLFVSLVYNSNAASYSNDGGETWNSLTLPLTTTYESLVYGDGKFLAIASNDTRTLYSSDGLSWIEGTILSGTWVATTFGNGKFVTIATGSKLTAYSSNGTSWETSSLPDEASWRRIAFGNGVFVAISRGDGKSAYSEDGVNWSRGSNLPAYWWSGLSYGNGVFVAVATGTSGIGGTNAYAYSLDNGVTWNSGTLPYNAVWTSIAYGNGCFMAVASNINYTVYSEDGIHWNSIALTSSNWSKIEFGGNNFVVIASNSTSAVYLKNINKKVYTIEANPTTSSILYSEPEIQSELTISSVGTEEIILSDEDTYYYNQTGNTQTYQSIGAVHPDWLCNINSVGVKIGNTIVATAGGSGSSYTAGTGIDITNDTISVDNTVALKSEIPAVDQTYSLSSISTNALSHKAIADSKFLQNAATGSFSISILGGGTASNGSINIGQFSTILGSYDIAIGNNSAVSLNAQYSIAIGSAANTNANYAIQLGKGINSEANSFYVGLSDSNNYKLLSSDGTIPNARLNVMTGADGTNAGTKGAVPAPTATDNTKFLRGDGTWAAVSGGGSDVEEYSIAEIEALWDGESE